GAIDHKGRREGPAQPAADGRDIILRNVLAEGRNEGRRHKIRTAGRTRPGVVAFDAEDPLVDLIVAADRAAGQTAANVGLRFKGTERSISHAVVRAVADRTIAAPGSAAFDTDVGTWPAIGRKNRHRTSLHSHIRSICRSDAPKQHGRRECPSKSCFHETLPISTKFESMETLVGPGLV